MTVHHELFLRLLKLVVLRSRVCFDQQQRKIHPLVGMMFHFVLTIAVDELLRTGEQLDTRLELSLSPLHILASVDSLLMESFELVLDED